MWIGFDNCCRISPWRRHHFSKKGVISRREVRSYAHGSSDLLGIEIDATINPGSFVPEIYSFTPFFIDTSPIYSILLFLVFIENENLYLYGLPNETWEVNIPIEEVPPELLEPALGINHVRDGMQKMDWLSLVVDVIVKQIFILEQVIPF
ncbi:hypothetical protein FEM48_Zijuj11G0085500 [Ziziphus jujuba var. spinosa]|uniref:PHD finger protein ALFIN-LIKE n=1 Tax=Ziziphus jujuba var. spinosa TaxID=714518 RepID=A0A978UHW7_ZIZJJ|nr:hypothetical protein FEM48_Zijuj11G0085500 [Ziziphus jujuba var. spinosa]